MAGDPVLRDIESAHMDFSVGRAPDVELGLVDIQLLKAQTQQRRGRQCPQNARQAQGFAPLRVQQRHVVQFKGRDQALRMRADAANANGHPQDLAGLYLKPRTKFSDSRHNPAMQHEPAQAKEQPDRHHQPQQETHDESDCPQVPGRQGGRVG